MAKQQNNRTETTSTKGGKKEASPSNENARFLIGILLLLFSLYAFFVSLSFFFTGGEDQSKLENITPSLLFQRENGISNWGGALGAYVSDFLLNGTFGLGSIFLIYFLWRCAIKLLTKKPIPLGRLFAFCSISTLFLSIFSGYFLRFAYKDKFFYLGGKMGEKVSDFLFANIGSIGILFLLFFLLISALILVGKDIKQLWATIRSHLHLPAIHLPRFHFKRTKPIEEEQPSNENEEIELVEAEEVQLGEDTSSIEIDPDEPDFEVVMPNQKPKEEMPEADPSLLALPPAKEEEDYDPRTDLPEYDPKLDLPHYNYPTLSLFKEYVQDELPVNMEELQANKKRITEVLRSFKVEIASIKATPGPTVTLYEIVPKEGVPISKVRRLEDDIALNLAALGIRIIAPIPGKGTIGIEVPNKNPQIVSMRSILESPEFQNSKAELPIALGKTITNNAFIIDLCKMPHVLVAGATGQGKSVGLNAIITSLLYKKHPSQVKLVLVDPKKVEFPIYANIERHFLAKLPDGDEAIITDVTKVVQTLTSITREMDDRYNLLNAARVRNIKEYNAKFVARRLNPEKGHRFMPYIVVIIDEFGDLIMTAGKEIELPIARIAQLARAVGIHMVIATQRPSTNIITGTIKANFPARIAFRVSSMVDSRTILDCPGANQLIGRGDMLISQGGGDLVRVQCAFIDTPEVEEISNYIGDQMGYETAYQLPEPILEGGEGDNSSDLGRIDPKFEEAARLVVATQEGSTSKIQRTMELGYNRAGRIMDQLEKAGIVGPSQGSKPRQVLIQDEGMLETILSRYRN